MKTLEGVAEVDGDIMGARKAVGRVEDIDAAWLEETAHQFEVGGHVIGMKMLEELITEGEVGTTVGKVEMISVVDDEFEMVREDLPGGTLVGDVDAVNPFAPADGGSAETAVARGELDQDGFGSGIGKMRAEESELGLEVPGRFLRGLAPGEPGMILNPLEEFGVEGLEQGGALLPR
jgi:hypothetical protein